MSGIQNELARKMHAFVNQMYAHNQAVEANTGGQDHTADPVIVPNAELKKEAFWAEFQIPTDRTDASLEAFTRYEKLSKPQKIRMMQAIGDDLETAFDLDDKNADLEGQALFMVDTFTQNMQPNVAQGILGKPEIDAEAAKAFADALIKERAAAQSRSAGPASKGPKGTGGGTAGGGKGRAA